MQTKELGRREDREPEEEFVWFGPSRPPIPHMAVQAGLWSPRLRGWAPADEESKTYENYHNVFTKP
jgi:hypothetical protein